MNCGIHQAAVSSSLFVTPVITVLKKEPDMSIGTILLIILVLILIGVIPAWPHSSGWGYGPSGGLGLVVLILLILVLMGKI